MRVALHEARSNSLVGVYRDSQVKPAKTVAHEIDVQESQGELKAACAKNAGAALGMGEFLITA